ncbi:MAG: helix-turn-helix domain-containing protein [Candidatus Eremiobacteraeota bacterium]|nr:helix-turn-helix domain-containing protein [Candidatus Eremiobacteraeota bacterium]
MRITKKRAGGPTAMFHPARIRIISILEAGARTAAEISHAMSDVPTATLYRHLKVLVDSGLLLIESPPSGRPGPAERIYSVNRDKAIIPRKGLNKLKRLPLRRHFATFVTSMLGDFERYTEAQNYDLEADGVRFRKVPLRLSASAHAAFLKELDALISRFERASTPTGRLRLFTHTSVPFAHDLEDSHEQS